MSKVKGKRLSRVTTPPRKAVFDPMTGRFVTTRNERSEAICAEIDSLRAAGYGSSWSMSKNGQRLSIEEMAADSVDNTAKYQANVTEMVRSRKAPGSQTDREFFSGLNLHEQYKHEKFKLDAIVAGAKRKGYAPQGDEIYQEGFERDEQDVGNPEYFISAKNGGRSQLKKLRQSRGLKPALR